MGQLNLGNIILQPFPLVTISNEIQKDGAGKPIGATTNITLKGEIFPTGIIFSNSNNNPSSEYTSKLLNSGINNIRQKLNDLFVASTPINLNLNPSSSGNFGNFNNCYIKKYAIDENENRWTNTIPYSIELICEKYNSSGNIYLVNSTNDKWTIEPIEEYWQTVEAMGATNFSPGFRVTHSVNAVGKYYPGKSPIQNAKEWVDSNITKASDINILDNNLILFNHVRKVNINKFDGSYGFDDTWIAFENLNNNNYAIETFEVEVNTDELKNIIAVIKGSVQGLEFFNKISNTGIPDYNKPYDGSVYFTPNSGRFANALKTYKDIRSQIYARANSVAGVILNKKPLSIVEGYDSTAGTITYSFSYNTRPKTLIDEAISESINIDTNYGQKELYASIFVIGRKLGPILQKINPNSAYSTTTVNYECILPTSGISELKFPISIYEKLESNIQLFAPENYLYVPESGFNWDMNDNRLTMTVQWVHK